MSAEEATYSLVAPAPLWDRLQNHLAYSGAERLAFGYCSASSAGRNIRFLLREIATPDDREYAAQTRSRVVLGSRSAIPYLVRARGSDAFLDAHSHPAGHTPFPSITDDKAAGKQHKSLQGPAPGAVLIRLIRNMDGEVWAGVHTASGAQPLQEIRVHGLQGLRDIKLINSSDPPLPTCVEDGRSVAVLGPGGLARLRRLQVAIIGVGGVGSVVARLLGGVVGGLALIDPDQLESHNVARLWYADRRSCGFKVRIARRALNRAFPSLIVDGCVSSFPSRESEALIRGADFVFVCPDHHAVRYAAARFAAAEMLPLLEVGCGGRMIDGKLSSLGYHVRLQIPGGPCLVCNGLETGRLEDPSTTETKRTNNYVENGQEVAGELGCLTARAASDAVDVFLRYSTGYMESFPIHLYGDVRRFQTVDLSKAFEINDACPICGTSSVSSRRGPEQRILQRATVDEQA